MFKNILYLGEIELKLWKKLTCIPIIFRLQFRYILPFFTNVRKRLMSPGSLKHTSSLKGSQKFRTHILTKVHSFSKYCFAQSSVDTIWWYLQLQLKVPPLPNCVNWRPFLYIWFRIKRGPIETTLLLLQFLLLTYILNVSLHKRFLRKT